MWGEDSHFDSYFSTGLVQPPTRILDCLFQFGKFWKIGLWQWSLSCYWKPIEGLISIENKDDCLISIAIMNLIQEVHIHIHKPLPLIWFFRINPSILVSHFLTWHSCLSTTPSASHLGVRWLLSCNFTCRFHSSWCECRMVSFLFRGDVNKTIRKVTKNLDPFLMLGSESKWGSRPWRFFWGNDDKDCDVVYWQHILRMTYTT